MEKSNCEDKTPRNTPENILMKCSYLGLSVSTVHTHALGIISRWLISIYVADEHSQKTNICFWQTVAFHKSPWSCETSLWPRAMQLHFAILWEPMPMECMMKQRYNLIWCGTSIVCIVRQQVYWSVRREKHGYEDILSVTLPSLSVISSPKRKMSIFILDSVL